MYPYSPQYFKFPLARANCTVLSVKKEVALVCTQQQQEPKDKTKAPTIQQLQQLPRCFWRSRLRSL